MREVKFTLAHAVEMLQQLGYPAVAVFGEGDEIAAIVFAESEDALRITMAQPERWEVARRKS